MRTLSMLSWPLLVGVALFCACSSDEGGSGEGTEAGKAGQSGQAGEPDQGSGGTGQGEAGVPTAGGGGAAAGSGQGGAAGSGQVGGGGAATSGSAGQTEGRGGDETGAGGASNSEGGASNPEGGAATEAGGAPGAGGEATAGAAGAIPLPRPSCQVDGGSAEVRAPELLVTLSDRWHEAWLGSPAVADINLDDTPEILVPRDELLLGWHADGEIVFRGEVSNGRIWAPPVVADLDPNREGLEVAVASRDQIYVWDAEGALLPNFPVAWEDELRALAAGDIDGDGAFELVAVSTNDLDVGDLTDILIAFEMDGTVVPGYPPNTTGTSGCTPDSCHTHAGFDQTLALGDLDGDGSADIFAPQDNAYVSLHHGDGTAFAADDSFGAARGSVNGIRFLHDLAESRQGYSDTEDTSLQAHFTNTAPVLVDLDGDGALDLVMLGSVQNASQEDRYKGVALWAMHPDGTRPSNWTEPLHFPDYLSGLWDFEDTNVVAATNQVSAADIDPDQAGPELVFAGFDGRIHAVSATRQELWSFTYTTSDRVLTGGVLVADLSRDGIPEVIFNSYSTETDQSHLFILDANGQLVHQIALPDRGAMPVPTVADVDGNDTLEIVVSLKDGIDRERQVLVYSVPDSAENCLLWPTGRANLRRDGLIPL